MSDPVGVVTGPSRSTAVGTATDASDAVELGSAVAQAVGPSDMVTVARGTTSLVHAAATDAPDVASEDPARAARATAEVDAPEAAEADPESTDPT